MAGIVCLYIYRYRAGAKVCSKLFVYHWSTSIGVFFVGVGFFIGVDIDFKRGSSFDKKEDQVKNRHHRTESNEDLWIRRKVLGHHEQFPD